MTIKHNTFSGAGKLVLLAIVVLVAFGCVPGGTSVPRGWSGAAVDGTTLYIGSMDGKIIALNASDGRRLWSAPLETAAPSGGFGCAAPPTAVAIYGSPVVSDNLVYLGGYNTGKFYAFALGEQEPRWVYPREGVSGTQIVGGGLVSDGRVFFGTASGKIYALNAATGSTSGGWIFPADGRIGNIWAAPASIAGTLFVSSFDKNLYAIDLATGQKKWTFATRGAIVASPSTDSNTVYVGSFDRNLYAVDAAAGGEKWKFTEAKNWYWAQPLVVNGKIYAANLDGKLYVLDAVNGSKLGEFDLGAAISSSPVLAGDLVVAVNEQGVVYSMNIQTNEKRLLVDLKEKVDAPLATDGTVVYVHTSTNKLHAVNTQTGGELWITLLTSD